MAHGFSKAAFSCTGIKGVLQFFLNLWAAVKSPSQLEKVSTKPPDILSHHTDSFVPTASNMPSQLPDSALADQGLGTPSGIPSLSLTDDLDQGI